MKGLLSAVILLVAGACETALGFDGTGLDGVGVYYGRGNSGGDSVIIYTMNLRTGQIQRLWGAAAQITSGTLTSGLGAYLTADGKRIVFSHGNNLSVINNDGTSARTILQNWVHDSWYLTANGAFYLTNPPDHHFQLYRVDIETGQQQLVYTFSMPICTANADQGTDLCMSQDGLKLHTHAYMINGTTDCMAFGGAREPFMTLNPDLSVADLGATSLWGHGSAVSRDGRYTFHNRWGAVPGADAHRHFWVCDFSTRQTIRDVLLRDPDATAEMGLHHHLAICQNDENFIGADLYSGSVWAVSRYGRTVIFERGDVLWTTDRQYEIPVTPPYSQLGNFWMGALPTPDIIPVLYLDKSELVFTVSGGTAAPATVAIANSGGGTLGQAAAARSAGASWLMLAVGGSGNSQLITNTVSAAGLADGVYRDTVTVSAAGAANTVRYPVTLNVNVLPGPTSLTAAAAGDSLLDAVLAWTDNAATEGGFAVERSGDDGATWTEIARTAANTMGYLDIRPPRGTQSYRVRAFSGGTYSAYSSVRTVPVVGKPWIVVSGPPAGAVWEQGTAHSIHWSANLVNGVTVSYTLDGGETWTLCTDQSIVHDSPLWGNYPWVVPDSVSAHAFVQVAEYGSGGTIGLSGGFVIAPRSTVPSSPYRDSGWTGSAAVWLNTTAAGANVSANLTGFPVLVRLNNANFDFSQSLVAGGGDIRFTKANGAALPCEIERWSDGPGAADTAEIWVRVDTVYGNTTRSLYMYWGKSGVTSGSNSAAVFGPSNGYAMVWHLADNAVTPIVADATGSNSGTYYAQSGGNNTGAHSAAGVIGRAMAFNRTAAQYVRNTTLYASTAPGDFTVSFWANADYNSFDNFTHSIGAGWGRFQFHSLSSRQIYVGVDESHRYSPSDLSFEVVDTAAWAYYVYTCPASGSAAFYKNGVKRNAADVPHTTRAAWGSFTIGATSASTGFSGRTDEVSVAGAARSAGWVKLCYENQKASQTLVTLSTNVQTPVQAPSHEAPLFSAADVRIIAAGNGRVVLVRASDSNPATIRMLALNGRILLQQGVAAGRSAEIPLGGRNDGMSMVVVQVRSGDQTIVRVLPALE